MSGLVPTDLHSHTYYSDARATPDQLMETRHTHGLKVVAVSDHDVMTGVASAAAAASARGMLLVPATEVTSVVHFGTAEADQIHILAYFPPPFARDRRLEKTALYRRGVVVQERWRTFVLDWVGTLDAVDRAILIARGGLEKKAADRFPGLQAVIDLVAQIRPALFDAFRKHHVHFWLDDKELFGWTPEEAIDAIRADGAVDVIAHPVRYKDKERLETILAYTSGIEAFTSRHNERVAARFKSYAEEHEKLWTASTDDHQQNPYKPPASGTPVWTIERIIGAAVPEELATG